MDGVTSGHPLGSADEGGVLLSRTSSHSVCRDWRVNVAHDLKNVDPVTNVPLAARVCYDVAGLQFSFQTDKFQDIVDYMDGNLGPLLSALCGYCWFVKVSCRPRARPPLPTSQ